MTKHALTLLCLLAAASIATAAPRPNLLIILVDDMGYGDPRCFNPESKIATPHIDKLAAEGEVHRCSCGRVHLRAEPV